MISFDQQHIYLYSQPIDMRKSINGLSYIVSDLSHPSLQDGSLTLFYNRARDKVKLLYWDKNGFVLIYVIQPPKGTTWSSSKGTIPTYQTLVK